MIFRLFICCGIAKFYSKHNLESLLPDDSLCECQVVSNRRTREKAATVPVESMYMEWSSTEQHSDC